MNKDVIKLKVTKQMTEYGLYEFRVYYLNNPYYVELAGKPLRIQRHNNKFFTVESEKESLYIEAMNDYYRLLVDNNYYSVEFLNIPVEETRLVMVAFEKLIMHISKVDAHMSDNNFYDINISDYLHNKIKKI